MPHLGSSWTTVFWAKLRKAAQKFMHTEGFQPSRSFWSGPRRRERRVRVGEKEGIAAALDNGPVVLMCVCGGSGCCDTIALP